MNRRILEHFGIKEKGFFAPPIFQRFAKDIQSAVAENDMVAIIGGPCMGKWELVKYAMREMSREPDKAPIFIKVKNKEKSRMTISSIINAIIYGLNVEAPKKDLEARSIQLIRLVGEKVVTQKRKICLIITDAHLMHGNTLRALKELRKDDFLGVSPLLSVLLIGHEGLYGKLWGLKDVFWRTQTLHLNVNYG